MVTLRIDDKRISVENGETILQAARENNISIPTLCYHEALEPYAACRLCLVELVSTRGSKLVAACTQTCEEGMTVRTNSGVVQSSRRVTAELLMSTGAHLPLVRSVAMAMGVDAARHSLPQDDCILCGLCVRACDELVGAHAISLIDRGLQKKFAPPFHIASAACIGCTTCVLICPTGAIRLEHITPTSLAEHDSRDCRLCGEQTLLHKFADADALLREEVRPV